MTIALAACVDEPELATLAHRLARSLEEGGVIYLSGDLGAGKTTFARALLSTLGIGVRIKSPTYSLIESYTVDELAIHHLDLYRIADASELEWLGLADLAVGRFLILIEWPERAGAALPPADLIVHLAHAGARRDLRMEPKSPRGERWVAALNAQTKPR